MCAFYIYKRKSKTKNRNSRESGLQHANIASDIPAILADFGDLYLDSLFIPTSIFLRLLSPFLCWAIRRDPPPLSLQERKKNYNFKEKKGKDVQITKKTSALTLFVCGALRVFQPFQKLVFNDDDDDPKINNSIRYSLRLYPIQTPTPPKRRWSNQIERENNVVGSRHGQLLRLHSCFLYNSPRLSIICSPQWAIGLRDVDPSVFFWPGCLHGYEAHKHSGKKKNNGIKNQQNQVSDGRPKLACSYCQYGVGSTGILACHPPATQRNGKEIPNNSNNNTPFKSSQAAFRNRLSSPPFLISLRLSKVPLRPASCCCCCCLALPSSFFLRVKSRSSLALPDGTPQRLGGFCCLYAVPVDHMRSSMCA